MDLRLPAAFQALAALKAPVTHYKVCSTLDSSPTVGSIGCAIDIGVPIFTKNPGAGNWQPLVAAAPTIGRHQVFGNLFAAHQGSIHRLDRHPVMQRHPVTPMDEADVQLHVARQTKRAIGLVDFVAMKSGAGLEQFEAELRQGRSILSPDVVDDETLRWVGRLIWNNRSEGIFAIGSQGVEYALVAHRRATGILPATVERESVIKQSQIVVVSGSISAVTAAQIEWAEANGFDLIALEAEASLDERMWGAKVDEALERARMCSRAGDRPLSAPLAVRTIPLSRNSATSCHLAVSIQWPSTRASAAHWARSSGVWSVAPG